MVQKGQLEPSRALSENGNCRFSFARNMIL